MPKKQMKIKNGLNKSKYKQLTISAFGVSYRSTCTIDKKECFKESLVTNTMENIVQTEINNERGLPFPLPRYIQPVDPNIIVISDEETSPKRKKVESERSKVSCDRPFEENGNQSKNLTTVKFPILRLKKTSSLVYSKKLTIGVFPPTKVDLVWDKSKPRILQEKSKNNQRLSFRNLVSDECIEDICPGELLELSPIPQSILNVEIGFNDVLQSTVVSSSNKITVESNSEINEENLQNWNYLRNFKLIYGFVSSRPLLLTLLSVEEVKWIDIFLNKLDERYCYLCIRLFIRIQRWHNIIKVKEEIKLRMADSEVKDMFDTLSKNGFIVSDISSDSPIELLNLLTVPDIRDICKIFKLKTGKENKPAMVKKLLENCNHQRVLVSSTSTTAILMEKIQEKMGICIKLNADFYNVLKKIHVLYKFTARDLKNDSEVYFFLDQILAGVITLPEYCSNSDTAVFTSIEEFESYVEAEECRKAMEQAFEKKQKTFMLDICELAYKKLLEIDKNFQDREPAHLFRFTPVHIYTKALSFGLQQLTKHYFERVEVFLKFLLGRKGYFQNMRGLWYDLLVMIQYKYCKKHVLAAETIIEALNDENLSEIDICLLNYRAENIKHNKSNRLPKLVSDRICFAQSGGKLPFIEIDARTIDSEGSSGKKRYIENVDGVIFIRPVEEIAITHYNNIGYSCGIHCEGRLIWTIFFLLLWDIIYDDGITDVFISEIQYLPLDFYTKEFYANRKDAIDELFDSIIQKWSNDQLLSYIEKNWKNHSHKKSLIDTNLSLDHKGIFDIILCITPEKVIKILRRLLSDMRGFRSGLPDLFLWDFNSKLYKFVEVKSEKDKLSHTQEVWLRFLKSIGCNIEICYVRSTGSKSRARFKRKQ